MKRRGFKWIWLVLGVLLISGTCGFGYEAKHTRTRFEEAKDAFAAKDWDRVIENLSDTSDPGRPTPKAFAGFLHMYVDPELATHDYKLAARETNSSLVPIKNENVAYQLSDNSRPPIVQLRYVDDAVWFDIPFSPKKMGMFRGKLVNMGFSICFYRVCQAVCPQMDRRNSWKSVISFVKSEKDHLTAMGLSPKNLYSQTKTWDEYADEYRERVEKWRKSQSP